MTSILFTFLYLWIAQDFASCAQIQPPVETLAVELGDTVTLNCTYECSSGFVRGFWNKTSDSSHFHGPHSNGIFCTIFLTLSNVTPEDVKKSYTCYTEDKEDPQLQQQTELIVFLQLQVQKGVPNLTVAPSIKTTINESLPAEAKVVEGHVTGIKVLASVTVTVAMVLTALAFYLCVNRNRQNWNGKGESLQSRSCSPQPPNTAALPVKGTLSTQSERVTLRIPPPDNESDTEVPYADIMITIRGVSTPELTQVSYLATGEKWGDESRSLLQASRSADRLHVPQAREISRKMSTNSEYAVITYA